MAADTSLFNSVDFRESSATDVQYNGFRYRREFCGK